MLSARVRQFKGCLFIQLDYRFNYFIERGHAFYSRCAYKKGRLLVPVGVEYNMVAGRRIKRRGPGNSTHLLHPNNKSQEQLPVE
jgi:hypothetical protein